MNRLKEARKAAGITQVEAAKAVGITQGGYSQWENELTKIDNQAAIKLADMFGVSVDYLLGRDNNPNRSVLRIPVIGSVPAGVPLEAIEDIIDWEEIPAAMAVGGKEYFSLEVKGDSMYPDLLDGDRVIVQKTQICRSGDICVVRVNGYEATIKEVQIGKDRSLSLIPRNRSYPPRTYSPEEIENTPVSIAGVVVELRRKIK